MNTVANSPVAPVQGPQYYRSFAGYEIPFRPDEPVKFADTVGLRSFYTAYHDAAGRVIQFDKIQLVRAAKEPRQFPLAAARTPGAPIYFEVVHPGPAQEPTPGEELDYRE